MTQYVCDKCGLISAEPLQNVTVMLCDGLLGILTKYSIEYRMDLCPKCSKALYVWLTPTKKTNHTIPLIKK